MDNQVFEGTSGIDVKKVGNTRIDEGRIQYRS